MKAQISRDSFQEEKTYSGVYQQQGRMLTDADWNEMVRILKHRMDKTVGGAIESGSPREGGILYDPFYDPNVSAVSAPKTFEQFVEVANTHKFRWGRIYVDGMYGEVRPKSSADESRSLSILEFIIKQRDYPIFWDSNSDPDEHAATIGHVDIKHVVYVDLWERLVVGFEDNRLLDSALHGADTCVRTQTMAQVKLAKLDPEEEFDIEAMPRCGNARLSATRTPPSQAPEEPCPKSQPVTTVTGNSLFRMEVHSVYVNNGKTTVELKWSSENGAEQRLNELDDTTFWDSRYAYECFSLDTEKLLGIHKVASPNNAVKINGITKSRLYSYEDYKNARNNTESPAKKMPFVRRWDGFVKIIFDPDQNRWSLADDPLLNASKLGDGRSFTLQMGSGGYAFSITLLLFDTAAKPCNFLSGDYWLVLLRDTGTEFDVESLSALPVGIHHHYLVLGQLEDGGQNFNLTKPQWRKLSFPSLTKLTLDRVLMTDRAGNEIPSIEDKFVDVEGDTMTGALKFAEQHDGPVGIQISTSAANGSHIDLNPPDHGSKALISNAAWISATAKDLEGKRNITLELGITRGQLDLNGQVIIREGAPARGKVLVSKDDKGTSEWKNPEELDEVFNNAVLIWLGW